MNKLQNPKDHQYFPLKFDAIEVKNCKYNTIPHIIPISRMQSAFPP